MLRVLLLNLCLIFGGGRPRVISYYPLSETVQPLFITGSITVLNRPSHICYELTIKSGTTFARPV